MFCPSSIWFNLHLQKFLWDLTTAHVLPPPPPASPSQRAALNNFHKWLNNALARKDYQRHLAWS